MKPIQRLLTMALTALTAVSCGTQFSSERALQGGMKALQAATISDADVQSYVRQYITQLDASSKVCAESNAYTVRLRKLTSGLKDVDGVPLNFKVYVTDQVNAFACADGSVRVYTGIMDLMSDDELLGVIGHEVGHVALKHSKKAMQTALLTSAALDGIASAGGSLQALSDSQLGAIGEAVLNAKFSRKQETQADDYGYEFLKSHGHNPWSLALGFEKLQSLEGSSATSNAVYQLFSSHPDTAERVSRISKRAAAEGFKRP